MATAGARSARRKKKRRGKVSFTAKDRKCMIDELQARDYKDVVSVSIKHLQSDRHLERYGSRRAFVTSVCSESVKPTLVQCMMEMVARYLEMLKACIKGKIFAKFEQQWFEHIHEYVAESGVQADLWKAVVSRAKVDVNKEEQRILVSTIVYHIYDLMTEKVKRFKEDFSQVFEEEATTSDKFTESNINLLRYGGFALHSMLVKRERRGCKDCEVELLKSLIVTESEWDEVPPAIQYLQLGGLDIISPRMLPFLRYVVEKTTSMVNDEMYKKQGRNMIRMAQLEFKADKEGLALFDEQIPVTFSNECKIGTCSEMTMKVFHARVNEYMSATEEVQLEMEGKVVKAEQSLRDSLKTMSAMKTRKQ